MLVLRHPLRNDSLLYNFHGDLLSATKGKDAGPWTECGGIHIDNAILVPERLVLNGHRVIFSFKDSQLGFEEFKDLKKRHFSPPLSPAVRIEVRLDHAVDSASQATEMMKNIFALDTVALIQAVQSPWNSYLKDHLVYDPSLPQEQEFHWQEPVKKQDTANPVSGTEGEIIEKIDFPDGPVKPPRPLHTPAPKFTELARYQELSGVSVLTIIVGIDGHVHNVRVAKPLGLGLDESASETVMKWRFDPSTKDGKPVAIEMNVEVAFNLH